MNDDIDGLTPPATPLAERKNRVSPQQLESGPRQISESHIQSRVTRAVPIMKGFTQPPIGSTLACNTNLVHKQQTTALIIIIKLNLAHCNKVTSIIRTLSGVPKVA